MDCVCGSEQQADNRVALTRQENERLEAECAELEALKKTLTEQQGGSVREQDINRYIDLLHQYNDLKDAAQAMLGKLAELQGVTTREVYKQFDLDTED